MRRAPALIVLATAVALAAAIALVPVPGRRALRAAGPVVDRGCKPLAPIEIALAPGPASGPVVAVSFTIRPLMGLQAASWAWDLSPGVLPVSGALAGTAQPALQAVTTGALTLNVPDDGAFHAATLVVTGSFAGSSEYGSTGPETITASSRVTWGPMPEPVPEVLTPDAVSGGWMPAAVVPASHEGPP